VKIEVYAEIIADDQNPSWVGYQVSGPMQFTLGTNQQATVTVQLNAPSNAPAGTLNESELCRCMKRAAAVDAIAGADRGIFIMMKTGCRPGEAKALRVANFDFATGEIEVYEALKGQGSGAVRGPTKTGEVGSYPASPELRGWVAKYIPTKRRFKPDAPLFANLNTGNPYSSQRLAEIWSAACTRAGVEYVPIYRAFKHGSFTALKEAGASHEEVQALARHRDPRTTNRYDLTDDQRRRRAMDRLTAIERRQQSANRRKKVAPLRKSSKSFKSDSEIWRPGRESNPRPPA
jgi:site-specific recombinase XerD